MKIKKIFECLSGYRKKKKLSNNHGGRQNFASLTKKFNLHEYMIASSNVSLMENTRSFMNRLNETDPNINLCGIPLTVSRKQLSVELIFKRCRPFAGDIE